MGWLPVASDDDNPEPAMLALCRFAWAVPGGTGHVCYQGSDHPGPHRCNYCGLKHNPRNARDQQPGTDAVLGY